MCCVCVCTCAFTHSHAQHPPSEKPFSSCLLRDCSVGDFSCSLLLYDERGVIMLFCWCLCLIAGYNNYKFSLAETFLNKRSLLSQLLSFPLCTPTPITAVAQGHLGFSMRERHTHMFMFPLEFILKKDTTFSRPIIMEIRYVPPPLHHLSLPPL